MRSDRIHSGEAPAAGPPMYPPPEERAEETHDLGQIQIHNSVIAVIAREAALKVAGVADLVGSLVDDIAGMVGRKPLDRGVRVEVADNTLIIEVALVVEYGASIPKVAFEVQSRIREDVERMTGKPVRSVNVIVQSVRLPETPAPATSSPDTAP
ncbi:MAG: Asp23/Gls24 family envelope stress response protein [Kiritimatiellae bacterium]|nr:Asp23/Gls24 family envelope stress response protein [Kiritimatiellia bacterium]